MRRLGPLVRLQIQTASLKRGEKPQQCYDPAALHSVDALRLNRKGASVAGPEGAPLLDVHHLDHPATRQTPGKNPLSLGFTHHYGLMAARFGPRVSAGIAGESLIVENAAFVPLEELANGVAIRLASGRLLELRSVTVAHPCRPFSLYLLERDAEPAELKETLRFLDEGMRGYYMVADSEEEVAVSLGDEVFAL